MKNKYFTHYIIVALFLCMACCREEGKIIRVAQNVPYEHPYSKESIGVLTPDASQISIYKEFLLIRDLKNESGQLYVYSLNTGSSWSFITRGRGPGEMVGFYDFFVREKTGDIYMLDISSRKIISINLDKLLGDGLNMNDFRMVNYPKDVNLLSICDGTNCFFCSTMDAVSRFAKIDDDGIFCPVGSYSPDTKKQNKGKLIYQAYMGRMAYNPALQSIVIACRYSDQLELYNVNTDEVSFIKGPEFFEPEYGIDTTHGHKALAHEKNEKFGYIAIAADSTSIWTLYSGRNKEERLSSYGKEIRQFSWDGILLRRFLLDEDALSFDISEDGKELYTISESSEIFKYSIY